MSDSEWTEDLNLSAEAKALINRTPFLLSLLYDMDLLPEQLTAQQEKTPGLIKAHHRLYGILYCYRGLIEAGLIKDDGA